jgi:hypothetical protein
MSMDYDAGGCVGPGGPHTAVPLGGWRDTELYDRPGALSQEWFDRHGELLLTVFPSADDCVWCMQFRNMCWRPDEGEVSQ